MVSRVTVIPSLLNGTLNGGLDGTLVPEITAETLQATERVHPYAA